jgi:hypothetical protein
MRDSTGLNSLTPGERFSNRLLRMVVRILLASSGKKCNQWLHN